MEPEELRNYWADLWSKIERLTTEEAGVKAELQSDCLHLEVVEAEKIGSNPPMRICTFCCREETRRMREYGVLAESHVIKIFFAHQRQQFYEFRRPMGNVQMRDLLKLK